MAYDDAGGVVAARLVWMLRALGLEAALLDGGLAGPLEAGGHPTSCGHSCARPVSVATAR